MAIKTKHKAKTVLFETVPLGFLCARVFSQGKPRDLSFCEGGFSRFLIENSITIHYTIWIFNHNTK